MNESVQNVNDNTEIVEIEEVVAPAEGASQEELDAYVKKLEDNNKQLYARTKKAEGFILKDGKWVKPAPAPVENKKPDATISKDTPELSQTDLFILMKADIATEDVEQVARFAKFEGITVAEALNHPVMKGILAEKKEARLVAEGTNTGGGKRGNAKVSDEALIENAREGKLPDNDADMARLTTLMRAKK